MPDFVAGDEAIVTCLAPVNHKTAVWVAGLRVSLGVPLPFGIVIPDAKRFGGVLYFDCGEKMVHSVLGRQIPTEEDNRCDEATEEDGADHEIAALFRASSI